MEIFADKTVFIAGAATDLAWRLLPVLEKSKARVILLDDDAEELNAMARKKPSAIEPLPVERLDAKTCAFVSNIWGEEPIDVFLDLVALTEAGSPESRLGTSHALLVGLEPALFSADGCVVSAIPQVKDSDDLQHQTTEAGQLRLARTLSEKWARWRVTYNVLRPEQGASSSAMSKAVSIAVRAGWDNFTGVHIPIASASH